MPPVVLINPFEVPEGKDEADTVGEPLSKF